MRVRSLLHSSTRLVAVLALLLVAQSRDMLAAEPWNPQPFEDDVLLDLPCGQKIAFRRIVTQEATNDDGSILSDRRVRLGSADIENAYIDYLRSDFISGSFSIDDRRFYLLGKYETTAAQYGALMSDGCGFVAADASLPVTAVSWFDATEFSRRLTRHLLAGQKETLRRVLGTEAAFVRLPTETEWEFAARGGVAVSVAEFQSARFPMNGDLNEYAWFNDPMSSQGTIEQIGILKSNPLGLFEMYGNAAEMMFDAFRLNKAGRSHGLAGGVIVKGGSFQSNRTFVNSSVREEQVTFDPQSAEERRPRTNGFRVALVGPALPTGADVTRLADEWSNASRSRLPAVLDPLELIADLRASIADLEISNGLATIDQAIRSEVSSKDEDRERLLDGILFSLGRTVSQMRATRVALSNRTRFKEQAENIRAFSDRLLDRQIEDDRASIDEQSYFAQELLVRIVDVFEPEEIGRRARSLAAELRQQHLADIADASLITADVAVQIATAGRQFTREQIRELLIAGL